MRKIVLLILVCTSFYQFITAQDIASNIRLNQIGFFPEAPKIAVIAEDKNSDFFVKSVTSGEVVFKSKLSDPRKSDFSPKVTRLADFSSVTKPGIYELSLPGQQDGCKTYPSHITDESYTDTVCSYASNEIAINWNASAAYLAGALEALYNK
jgi:endoglucanase